MTHVVTANCGGCRFTECISVCPVECFHIGDDRLAIDPDICIDCGGCVPACPVDAIVDEVNLADDEQHWVEDNRACAAEWPLIIKPIEALSGADERRAALGK